MSTDVLRRPQKNWSGMDGGFEAMVPDTPIGVTLGDPAGVGPEVLDRALEHLGAKGLLRLYGPDVLVRDLARRFPWCVPVATSSGLDGVEVGRYTSASGRASILALEAAIGDLASGEVRALVTGPISKTALVESGLDFPGQTEWVAQATGAERFAMMLMGPRLRVTLVTTHLALRDVPAALSQRAIEVAVVLTYDFLRDHLRIGSPRIGVLGLNPHCSDQGRFGDEEGRIIAPAVEALARRGAEVRGPLSADTAFHRALSGEFDAIVAMYHDQGLGPLKTVHFEDAINVTLGLPRLRCSPDHGPAFDLAGKGRASHASMLAALRLALRGSQSTKDGFPDHHR